MNNPMPNVTWSENILIVDADYVDSVAFNLIVNFERMLERRIPQADLARWIDCVALDGGLREGEHDTQVVLIHDKQSQALKNFSPASYADELNGKAFKDHLGEFAISAIPVEAMGGKDEQLLDTLRLVCGQTDVKRIMVVADMDRLFADVRHAIRQVDDEQQRITLFAMQPLAGSGPFRQEILGYSLMAALGIRGDEIKA